MSFFSALTVPGLQQHLSFSREDSAILKGYGILFMIFHHVFGLYALPAGVDTAWIAPSLPKPLPSLKFAYPFLFLSRGTLWDGKQIHPQPSVPSLKQAFPITLNSGKFISYASFWLFWFPGHSLCPSCHPLPTWIGKMACLS